MEFRPRTNLVLGPAILAAKLYNSNLFFFSFTARRTSVSVSYYPNSTGALLLLLLLELNYALYAHGPITTKNILPAAQMTTKP